MKNVIFKNVLTDEQIKQIYEIVESTPDEATVVQDRIGHKAYLVSLGENVREHLEKLIQDYFGDYWILNAYQFARYSNSYGYVPKLYPHFDDAFSDHKLTLDVQIKGTKPWAIVVEGDEYILNDNEAVTFSGTDQIHWRSDLELEDEDYFDMIFCHFSRVDDPRGKIGEDWLNYMKDKEKFWLKEVGISPDAIKIEDK